MNLGTTEFRRIGVFGRFTGVRMGSPNAGAKTIYFPGIAGRTHAHRKDVKHLLAQGHEVVGVAHHDFLGRLPTWARLVHEALRRDSIYAPRRQLFETVTQQERGWGLLAQSLASYSTVHLAVECPDRFAAVDSYVHKSMAFGSPETLPLHKRWARRAVGVEDTFRRIQEGAPRLRDVLAHYQIPICLIVPLQDHIVDARLTRQFFHQLGPRVERRAVVLRDVRHDIFNRETPDEVRAYVCEVIEAALAKRDLPKLHHDGIVIVKGDERWPL